MERDYYLLAFRGTHDAMAAERALSGRLPVAVMPTLRQITASCGISLRVESADFPALKRELAAGTVPAGTCRLYRVEGPAVRELIDEKGGD